jgi:hypothetical protein
MFSTFSRACAEKGAAIHLNGQRHTTTFISGFSGMNIADIRDIESSQSLLDDRHYH